MTMARWSLGMGLWALWQMLPAAPGVDFNREVRPLLSDRCFACHGPDEAKRKAKLRLDLREDAVRPRESGSAIVPGNPEASELVRRIRTADPDDVMPPPEAKKSLTPAERDVLARWIATGAQYDRHWAFTAPRRPALPADVPDPGAGPIDPFVRARLAAEGWTRSPKAARETYLRRVTFDLTGLPPTAGEIDRFLADTSPGAVERVVDRLLAAPAFGERIALHWLDLSRYADTHGYHLDSGREMWRWRDWVIDAFNRSMPFDQFVRDQLAGDLYPNASSAQVLATGFCRNNMVNFEGGAIAEEYLNAYIVDRVTTFSTVFLGLTMQCAQCHDHKFDPITMRDFYGLYAYFNAVPEKGLDGNKGNAAPVVAAPTPAQERTLEQLRAAVTEATAACPPGSSDGRVAEARKALEEFEKSLPTVMVMRQMDRARPTHLLMRGQYNQPGEEIGPSMPAALGGTPAGAPPDRRALAAWLTAPEHPLLARVAVNRFWSLFFGNGLVKTANDFGSQGEWPSHPELLDWLAVEFRESGWDVKHIVRLIVTSETYRQSAAASPEAFARDPENRLLARGPRQRLQAEFIRDAALALAGVLDPRIGGPSASPYQPSGLWEELNSRGDSATWTGQKFVQSHGAELYRRGMYTYWKRTCPPPNLGAFDAPDRETCLVQRSVTNTPLQALTLLNDPTFVEAARLFAARIVRTGGSDAARLVGAFREATGRRPEAAELEALTAHLDRQRQQFGAAADDARQLIGVGEAPPEPSLAPAELAAWTVVASVLLNLDETITR